MLHRTVLMLAAEVSSCTWSIWRFRALELCKCKDLYYALRPHRAGGKASVERCGLKVVGLEALNPQPPTDTAGNPGNPEAETPGLN